MNFRRSANEPPGTVDAMPENNERTQNSSTLDDGQTVNGSGMKGAWKRELNGIQLL